MDFSDVWLAYNEEFLAKKQFAVEAIDLQVRQGEFIAIVGPSGCGKSTFMKLATGLKMPSRGKIMIDGQPVTGPLKVSGMSFQAPSLLPWRQPKATRSQPQECSGSRAPNFMSDSPLKVINMCFIQAICLIYSHLKCPK